MVGNFLNLSGQYKKPYLLLTNPNKDEIAILNNNIVKNINLSLRFNNVSELTFDAFSNYKDDFTSKNIKTDYFELIVKKRLIKIEDFGWFEIINVENTYENNNKIKKVTCFSYEYTLNSKDVNLLDDTYKFYNEVDPKDEKTLLGKLLKAYPNWNTGQIDSNLWNKYRTFQIPASKIYGFLMNDVEKAYEVIFTFDTENQKINAYSPKSIVKNTDIVLSFDNLINNIKIQETDRDIVTVLGVYGAGDLDIRNVNPTGSAQVYNFNYYKNLDWMSQELIDAINLWENKIEQNRPIHGNLLAKLKALNSNDSKYPSYLPEYGKGLIQLKGELTELKSQLKALEEVRVIRIAENNPALILEITQQIEAKKIEITNKEIEVKNKETEISNTQIELKEINTLLKIENNFTEVQYSDLSLFMYTGTYQNQNYVKTNIMTPTDILDVSEQLLEQGKNSLDKLSQPNYIFTLDSSNFLFQKEFKTFVEQLELGSLINVNIGEYDDIFNWTSPILLELRIDYENPDNFSMTFGNRFRLDTSEWTYLDLVNEQIQTTNNMNIQAPEWQGIVNSDIVSTVEKYINNNLELAKQEIIGSVNNSFSIGGYGLRATKVNDDGSVDSHQLAINNNLLVMTDDNWETIKLAIGFINGKYSVNAEVIAGKLLVGEQLYVTNIRQDTQQEQTFMLDANGAVFKNCSITAENDTNKLIIDPVKNEIFKVQKKRNNIWEDALWLTTEGDANFNGTIYASQGKIGFDKNKGITDTDYKAWYIREGLIYTDEGELRFQKKDTNYTEENPIMNPAMRLYSQIINNEYIGELELFNRTSITDYTVDSNYNYKIKLNSYGIEFRENETVNGKLGFLGFDKDIRKFVLYIRDIMTGSPDDYKALYIKRSTGELTLGDWLYGSSRENFTGSFGAIAYVPTESFKPFSNEAVGVSDGYLNAFGGSYYYYLAANAGYYTCFQLRENKIFNTYANKFHTGTIYFGVGGEVFDNAIMLGGQNAVVVSLGIVKSVTYTNISPVLIYAKQPLPIDRVPSN